MTTPNVAAAGTFFLGGQVPIHRLAYGAVRITGAGSWGEPEDPAECLATLRRLPELGVNFIDTADSYGPEVSERMLREALHPYPEGMVIATKAGQAHYGPNDWVPLGRPEYLMQQAQLSRRRLGVECIDLWTLHRIDPKVPRDEQFDAIRQLLDQGVIRYAGLSEVTIEEIQAASRVFPVATVQNHYSVTFRVYDKVLDYCEQNDIGFMPWYPLSGGQLSGPDSPLAEIARRREATPSQIALAWLLQRSPVMLPIPGTSKRPHLEENVAAANIQLNEAEFDALAALWQQRMASA